MSRVLVLCADKVEEIECLTVVDFCRRAHIEVVTASVTESLSVTGDHGVIFKADVMFSDIEPDEFDAVVFPGGKGAWDLANVLGIEELAVGFAREGKLVAAICAAPGVILAPADILINRTATGYPGCNPEGKANWTTNLVERDGNIITGKGPAAAAAFAVEIIRYLEGDTLADDISRAIMMPMRPGQMTD